MRTLYIECNMGAAGDMLMGALLELIEDKAAFIKKMNELNIPKVRVSESLSTKCGITGTHVSVEIDGKEEHENHHEHHQHGHHHTSMEYIVKIINAMEISNDVKKSIRHVYEMIAEAESHVHGKPVSEIHFHEVGMMDAIVDITGCCLLIHEIQPEKIVVSPIKTGFGQVHCAHGIVPVPAPATAFILQGIPNSTGSIEGELCTPTGAAIIKHFVDEFGYQPQMKVEKIGYGMGNKDFESANCVRAFLGEEEKKGETIIELSCNIDDMTPEEIGYATEVFMKEGALDVYTIPIGMKKSRTGMILTVMCSLLDKEPMTKLIFKHTTTLGIRQYICERRSLKRETNVVNTPYGDVRIKKSEGYGTKKMKPEYEDIKKICEETGKSMMEICEELRIMSKE